MSMDECPIISHEWVTVYPRNHTIYEFDDVTFLVDGEMSGVVPVHLTQRGKQLMAYLSAGSPDAMNPATRIRANEDTVPIVKNVAPIKGASTGHIEYCWKKLCQADSFPPELPYNFTARYDPYVIYSTPNGSFLLLYVLQGNEKDAEKQREAIVSGNETFMRNVARLHGLVSLLVYIPPGDGARVTRVLLTGTCTRDRIEAGLQRTDGIEYIKTRNYFSKRTSSAEGSESNESDGDSPLDYPLCHDKVKDLSPLQRNSYYQKFYEIIQNKDSQIRPLAFFDVIHLPSGMNPEEAAAFVSTYQASLYFMPTHSNVNNLLNSEEVVEALSNAFRKSPDGQMPRIIPSHSSKFVTMLKNRGLATRQFIVLPPTHEIKAGVRFNKREQEMAGNRYEIHA